MNKIYEFEHQVIESIAQKWRYSIVLIEVFAGDQSGNGSGFIIGVDDRFYLFTCAHVVDLFYDRKVLIHRMDRLGTLNVDKLNLLVKDYVNDIAIFRITEPLKMASKICQIEMCTIRNFRRFKKSHYCVMGFPAELRETIGIRNEYTPIFYTTATSQIKLQKTHKLVLEYPTHKEIHELIRRKSKILPKAQGFSGAAVVSINMHPQKGQIWTSDDCKLIGIQYSTIKGKSVQVVSIKLALMHLSKYESGFLIS
jgi:hypothetical protein